MPETTEPDSGASTEARHEAAQVLRRLLLAVEAGELEAKDSHAKALLRRVEGAVVGLEVEVQDLDDPPE